MSTQNILHSAVVLCFSTSALQLQYKTQPTVLGTELCDKQVRHQALTIHSECDHPLHDEFLYPLIFATAAPRKGQTVTKTLLSHQPSNDLTSLIVEPCSCAACIVIFSCHPANRLLFLHSLRLVSLLISSTWMQIMRNKGLRWKTSKSACCIIGFDYIFRRQKAVCVYLLACAALLQHALISFRVRPSVTIPGPGRKEQLVLYWSVSVLLLQAFCQGLLLSNHTTHLSHGFRLQPVINKHTNYMSINRLMVH